MNSDQRSTALENLRRFLSSFPEEFLRGLVRSLSDSVLEEFRAFDANIVRTAIEQVLGQSVFEVELFRERNGDIFFLDQYQFIERLEDVELIGIESSLPDYRCIRVKKDARYFILEIINEALLKDRDFASHEEWESYLQLLQSVGVIDLAECSFIPGSGQTVAVYGIAENFEFLNQIVTENPDLLANTSSAIQLLNNLNTLCGKTARITERTGQRRVFSFVTAHSHFILVDDKFNTKLVAVGASLVSRPRYVSTTRHKRTFYPHGLGLGAYSFFMGLLLFELLTDRCPVQIWKACEATDNCYLSNDALLNTHPQHVRAIIKRATHNYQDYRYPSATRLGEDLRHVQGYLAYCRENNLDAVTEDIIELVDFMRLRMKAHSQNPRLGRESIEGSGYWFLTSVAKDLNLFLEHGQGLHDFFVEHAARNNAFTSQLSRQHNLTPFSDHLLDYLAVWLGIVREWNHRPSAHPTPEVEFIGIGFLIVIIEYELIAYAQSVARDYIYQRRNDTPHMHLPAVRHDFRRMESQDPQRFKPMDFATDTMEYLNTVLAGFVGNNQCSLHIADDLGSFEAIAVLVMLAGKALFIVNEHNQRVFPNIENDTRGNRIGEYLEVGNLILWYAQKLGSLFPKNIESNDPKIDPTDSNLDEWCNFADRIIDRLIATNPAKRIWVSLEYKRRFLPEDIGCVRYRTRFAFRKKTLPINECDLIRKSDIQRNIIDPLRAKADILSPEEDRIGAILVKPPLAFPRLYTPVSESERRTWQSLTRFRPAFLLRIVKRIALFAISLPIIAIVALVFDVQPQAEFQAYPRSGYAPLQVQFDNRSSNATDYVWVWSATETSNESNPVHEYQLPGDYEAKLIAYRWLDLPNWLVDLLDFKDEEVVEITVLPVPTQTSP